MVWKLDKGMLSYNGWNVETSYDDNDNQIELKVSPDNKYAAVCNIHSYYTDLYKVIDDEPQYMYSLRRNTYRTEGTKYLLEFFTSPKDPESTLFIFNKEHGIISVCDAETGQTVHTDEPEDKFITDYKVIDNKYIYLIGWYWSPIYFTALYKINDLLQRDEYQCVKIDYEPIDTNKEFVFRLDDTNNNITFCNKNHKLYKEYSLDDFYKNHESIIKKNKDIELSENIINNKNNLFHKLINEDYSHLEFIDDARQVLIDMLNKELSYEEDDIIKATCIGNKTGSDLSHHLWKFASNINFDDTTLNYLVPRVMTHGFTKKIATLTQITMTISMKRNDKTIKIVMNQEMTLMTESYLHCNSHFDLYEVDENKPCYIVVSYEKK